MKEDRSKKLLLEQLRRMPVIQIACEKSGVARATFYRWKKKNKKFAKEVEEAITNGEALITDLSETQLVNLIRDKNFQAVQLWLRSHHPKYANKLELSGKINTNFKLTKEQKASIRRALKLSSLRKYVKDDKKKFIQGV